MTRILIVDDEAAASNILKMLIEKHVPAAKDIKTCNSPEEALTIIQEWQPDLLMLDIEMPNMNGFDLLNRVGNSDFDVVFTTAYDKYAIKAIRFSALDYLLKPVDIAELQNAINKHIIKRFQPPREQQKLVSNLISNLQQKDQTGFKLALSTTEGVFFFIPSEIIRLEGESNYTRFYFASQKPMLVSRTLKEYEDILSEHDFIRAHKSHLVNKKFVKYLDKEGLLWLTDGSHIIVSRRKKEEVLKELSNK
ncbi:MAG TPA: LytTR family DNA-binding domain-containing protein [Chitinophagaceae bacterium]|nr:LytTR family DNA-binding domain-containing protein [Chitinophagaceae bacterium]